MFPITISFTCANEDQLTRVSAALSAVASTVAGETVPKKGTPDPQSERNKPEAKPAANAAEKATPDPKSEAPAAASAAPPAATPATQGTTAAASGDDPKQLDYDRDVKPAFLKLVQTKGRAAGRKIIDAFAPTKEKLSEAITTQEQYKQALDLIAKEMA